MLIPSVFKICYFFKKKNNVRLVFPGCCLFRGLLSIQILHLYSSSCYLFFLGFPCPLSLYPSVKNLFPYNTACLSRMLNTCTVTSYLNISEGCAAWHYVHKWWNRELTLKCKLKCYVRPKKNPLGVSPSKGNQGANCGKDLGGSHDLRIRSTVTLPTELRGRREKVGDNLGGESRQKKIRVHMNVVPCSTMNTNGGTEN